LLEEFLDVPEDYHLVGDVENLYRIENELRRNLWCVTPAKEVTYCGRNVNTGEIFAASSVQVMRPASWDWASGDDTSTVAVSA
jgi:hypothetical protein